MNTNKDNPLLSPQREKSGSATFNKYLYQYDWALFKIIKKHQKKSEYAVFIELHEDVVISSSLNIKDAKFEFNQVKTSKGKFTLNRLTTLKKGSSVLGKLLDSCINKDYSKVIDKINFVAVNGFSSNLHSTKYDYEELCITDLEEATIEELENKLKNEIGCNSIPRNIYFITPQLSETNHQTTVIGEISNLINMLFPSSLFNSTNIYRTLFDELTRKGTNTFDYKLWDEALVNKALTSKTVSEVINAHTNFKDNGKIHAKFAEVCNELGITFMQRKNLERSFSRYQSNSNGKKTTQTLRISNEIKKEIEKNESSCKNSISKLLELVGVSISSKTRKNFPSETDFKSAVIYEYICLE